MTRGNRTSDGGFSLVEVMVALVVISVGLLGIAKMQALSLSSTGSAKTRSLAALEAASLGATMQADRAYWSAIATANFNITVPATGAITSSPTDPNLVAPSNACLTTGATANTCTSAQLAAQDLKEWNAALHSALPNSAAVIACNTGAVTTPATCTITITWTDHVVAVNVASNTASTSAQVKTAVTNFATATSKYQLFVEP
jgi:type IV pilus assembly protein PilV